jgi:hypothetical protein
MNTILFVASGVVLLLVILAKIPGLEHTVRPMIDLVFSAIKFCAENMVSWSIWLFKVLTGAHSEVFRHLLFSAEALDPSVEMRESAEKG